MFLRCRTPGRQRFTFDSRLEKMLSCLLESVLSALSALLHMTLSQIELELHDLSCLLLEGSGRQLFYWHCFYLAVARIFACSYPGVNVGILVVLKKTTFIVHKGCSASFLLSGACCLQRGTCLRHLTIMEVKKNETLVEQTCFCGWEFSGWSFRSQKSSVPGYLLRGAKTVHHRYDNTSRSLNRNLRVAQHRNISGSSRGGGER